MDNIAVPLTPEQIDVLVAGLSEDDHLTREYALGPNGAEFSRDEAQYILRTADAAVRQGHSTIPLFATRIGLYEMVLGSLKQWAPEAGITQQFAQLLADLPVLEEMARAQGWKASRGPAAQWEGTPPAAPELTP